MTNLSPSAQAILDAFNAEARPEPHHQRQAIAASLRVAADCIVFGKLLADSLEESIAGRERLLAYQKLRTFADELEGTDV